MKLAKMTLVYRREGIDAEVNMLKRFDVDGDLSGLLEWFEYSDMPIQRILEFEEIE